MKKKRSSKPPYDRRLSRYERNKQRLRQNAMGPGEYERLTKQADRRCRI